MTMTKEQKNLRKRVKYHWDKVHRTMDMRGLSYVEWFRGDLKFYYFGKHYVIRNLNCDDESIIQIY